MGTQTFTDVVGTWTTLESTLILRVLKSTLRLWVLKPICLDLLWELEPTLMLCVLKPTLTLQLGCSNPHFRSVMSTQNLTDVVGTRTHTWIHTHFEGTQIHTYVMGAQSNISRYFVGTWAHTYVYVNPPLHFSYGCLQTHTFRSGVGTQTFTEVVGTWPTLMLWVLDLHWCCGYLNPHLCGRCLTWVL